MQLNYDQPKQQHHQQQLSLQTQQQPRVSASNRWTHFGARLRPLAQANGNELDDHHEVAANSKSMAAISPRTGSTSNGLQQRGGQSAAGGPQQIGTSTNGAPEPDELDDDQDNEALLYKMMQQQSFLMSPTWQDSAPGQAPTGLNLHLSTDNLLAPNDGQREQEKSKGNGGNSKRIIKLLKSYSHIHQVDDSDDQIRGTYTRLPARKSDDWQQASRGR